MDQSVSISLTYRMTNVALFNGVEVKFPFHVRAHHLNKMTMTANSRDEPEGS